MPEKYILCYKNAFKSGSHNAGAKAGADIFKLSSEMGYNPAGIYESKSNKIVNGVFEIINSVRFLNEVKPDDIVLIQYPATRAILRFLIARLNRKKVNVILLIHDIDFLRAVPTRNGTVEDMKSLELSILKKANVIIAHNKSMEKTLQAVLPNVQFVSLELFDYLYNGAKAQRTNDGSVIVAGNLLKNKAGYIYSLKEQHFKLILFGSNLDKSFDNDNAKYIGSFPPDKLIPKLSGSYGLVWDGPDAETCGGQYGEYLRYNNPHKVSLYIASGIPVIVWKESALYPFIKENNLGFGVDSLYEIDTKTEKNDYSQMVINVEEMGEKVRTGYFFRKAIKEAESRLS